MSGGRGRYFVSGSAARLAFWRQGSRGRCGGVRPKPRRSSWDGPSPRPLSLRSGRKRLREGKSCARSHPAGQGRCWGFVSARPAAVPRWRGAFASGAFFGPGRTGEDPEPQRVPAGRTHPVVPRGLPAPRGRRCRERVQSVWGGGSGSRAWEAWPGFPVGRPGAGDCVSAPGLCLLTRKVRMIRSFL